MKKLAILLIAISGLTMIIFPSLVIGVSGTFSFGNREIKVYNTATNKIMTLELEEYIKGVLAAEMPGNFALEALKAQAVAARTYTLKKLKTEPRLTTDSSKDQAWVSRKELLHKWGLNDYLINWCKISSAVEATEGIVMSYNGELISAVYHSTSGGITASAQEVWGREIPYLSNVTSKHETLSPYYQDRYQYTAAEICRKLGIKRVSKEEINVSRESESGRVVKLKIGDKYFSGQKIRKVLNLPSTRFKIQKAGNKIEFITSGYGHGVGLSQYGAQGMANQGYNFIEILQHYYQGINLRRVN